MGIKKKISLVGILLLFLILLYFGAQMKENPKQKQEVVIAVLDTGYSGESNRVLKGIATIGSAKNTWDNNGHGTGITEIILEETDDWVYVLPIKIADYTGCSTEEAAYQGIKYAIEYGVDIIHMSLNMSNLDENSELIKIVKEAITEDIEIVVSAGNSGKDTIRVFPANIEETIVVSAVDEEEEFCSYSNYGETIDFAAAGFYKGESGTSYAAARVTGVLAREYSNGGNVQTLQRLAVDKGINGKDIYYGHGILRCSEKVEKDRHKKIYVGKSKYDIGYEILDIDWHNADAELLDKYFVETHAAYVGMYLSKMEETELQQLKKKSKILDSMVLVQEFACTNKTGNYEEKLSYQEGFVTNAIKEYQKHEEELTISAEWLMLNRYGYFVISSDSRNDIFHFRINGFKYTSATNASEWFPMFNPEKFTVTRTIVKQTTDFGEVDIAGFSTYLCSGNSFASKYMDPITGEVFLRDNFYAIDTKSDGGTENYGLSIILEGYKNEKEGYHTEETDIVLMPYDYTHAHEKYTYEEYKTPLRYIFAYYDEATNSSKYSDTPQRVEEQEKNFMKLIKTDQTLWYNGVYKEGYDYRDVDESLSLEEKISKYLKSYSKKVIKDVNIYSEESSLSDSGFTINANLEASLGIQWNNGETTIIAAQNDIPEYNFPLVLNRYEIIYNGNGATGGGMSSTPMEYNQTKALEENQYSKRGYLFLGWSTTENGEVEYLDGQEVCNLSLEHNVQVVLYAVWDEYPWIIAEDLYFSLEEAQNGTITYERLMEYARAEDREAGGVILPGIDKEKGTTFMMLDYVASNYTELLQEGDIAATYQVIDSVGNMYEKQITVHIIDTSPKEELPIGKTRFISEKYYMATYEEGGLETNSIWKANEDYVNTMISAFENRKNKTPMLTFRLSYDEIVLMKEVVWKKGMRNNESVDVLQYIYERFLSDGV